MNKELQNKIITSLTERPEDWYFEKYIARNTKNNIELWTANRPYADLSIFRPTETRRITGYFTRIKVRKLIDHAKELQVLKQFKDHE